MPSVHQQPALGPAPHGEQVQIRGNRPVAEVPGVHRVGVKGGEGQLVDDLFVGVLDPVVIRRGAEFVGQSLDQILAGVADNVVGI